MTWDSKRLGRYGVVVLIIYVASAGVLRAASKPFWFDELCTLTVARQPTWAGIFDALQNAVDSQPPPFYLVERMAGAAIPNEEIAYRLPSILALCCIIFFIFVYVGRWYSAPCALVCAALPLISILYRPYAVEARGYELATAFIAAALVCYQRADALRWAILMAISLAAASASHYYGVFALAPFALAEAALVWKTRRLRWSVWFAMSFGVVPLIVFGPMLSHLKQYYGAHYWAGTQPTLVTAASMYGSFFNVSGPMGIALAAVATVGVSKTLTHWRPGEGIPHGTQDAPFHEKILALGLLALPFVFLLAMKVAHGGLVDRYLLPTILGFSLAAGYILPRLGRRSAILFAVLIAVAIGAQEMPFWLSQRLNWGHVVSPAAPVEELANAAGFPELPVVVSDGQDYLQLVHYGSPNKPLCYLVDLRGSMRYAGSDFLDKNLLVLRRYAPLQVYDFRDFVLKNQQFLLYSRGSSWDWLPARLFDDHYTLRLLAIHDREKIYLVTRPNPD
jgi:hypothetical protein